MLNSYSKLGRRLCLLLICTPLTAFSQPTAEELAASVVVIANSSFEGSEEVARSYLAHRNIPEKNLILVSAPIEETISRQQFVDTLHNPIVEQLLERGLVEGMPGSTDAFGRKQLVVLGPCPRYMVLCYGVPLRIKGEPLEAVDDMALRQEMLTGNNAQYINSFSAGPLAKNQASVDGELALALVQGAPLNGFVPNPYFRRQEPLISTDTALKVTRLDGPSVAAVKHMLEQSLKGEREGLMGRAYVDEDTRGGGFAQGNEWLSLTADLFRELAFDLSHETTSAIIPEDARFDAPALYAGWYTTNAAGPFILSGFKFPAGAVAVHLHSYSASTVRSPRQQWVGPLVERGVSATLGNVYEPYLMLTHHYHLFFMALAKGLNFADAAYFALPGLSWQAVAIGDPLFRPFAKSFQEQLAAQQDLDDLDRNAYVILRQANALIRADSQDRAERLLLRAMIDSPSVSVALHRARILQAAGKTDEAVKALQIVTMLQPTQPIQWGLFAEVADALAEWKAPSEALGIYQNILKQRLPKRLSHAYMQRAIPVAHAAGRPDLATEWQVIITPPPPPPPPTPADPAPAEQE